MQSRYGRLVRIPFRRPRRGDGHGFLQDTIAAVNADTAFGGDVSDAVTVTTI